jgi:hypothetical protein
MAFRRFVGRYGVFMLGLGMMAGSARATITYQTSLATFGTQASVTDGLTVSSPITFTGSLCSTAPSCANGVIGDEYVDTTTGIEFLAFNGSGSSNVAFASVTGGVLNTTAGLGDSIEVIFPTSVDYGFAFNFTTAWSFETFCIDTTTAFSNCASGGTSISSGNSGFIGAINDNSTPAFMPTIWLALGTSGSAGTDIQSFEVATQSAQSAVPEGPTNLLIGSGLSALYWLHRRRRQPLPV